MNKIYSDLHDCRLFDSIENNDIEKLILCLCAKRKDYFSNELIFSQQDKINSIGILLDGNAIIYNYDYSGNRNILAHISKNNMFGESFAVKNSIPLPFYVEATTECSVLFIEYSKLIMPCSSCCNFHARLVNNLITILAEKNIELSSKALILSKRTTREKLLSFFISQASKKGDNEFSIIFSRQQLADFIAVDRSAMCNEMSKMKKEGLIDYNGNTFRLFHNK